MLHNLIIKISLQKIKGYQKVFKLILDIFLDKKYLKIKILNKAIKINKFNIYYLPFFLY